jgi:hypothetical protein
LLSYVKNAFALKQTTVMVKPTKKQKVSGAPLSGGGDRSKRPGSRNTAPKAVPKGYEWQPFTTKSVNFVTAARELSEYVSKTYGTSVSITQYEKFLVAYSQMTLEERSRHTIDENGVTLAMNYQTSKDARDSERQSFRGDIQVADVQGTLASLAASFQDQPGLRRAGQNDDDCDQGGGETSEMEGL